LQARKKRPKSFKKLLYYETDLKKKGFDFIIGVDEAGRGPLAGPVVAAAAVLNTYRFKNRIDDSKKLTALSREKAFLELIDKSVFGIGIIGEKIIDRVNILQATRLAMEQAINFLIDKLSYIDSSRIHIIVDGNVKLNSSFPYTNIINGDAKSKSIACASILAKVTRDHIMRLYDRTYPQYKFIIHKGYPTKMHKEILKRLGPCLIHRKSFSAKL
jgi:ribonuclease HII